MKVTRFRPEDDPRNDAARRGDVTAGEVVEWEDNLFSNSFAWGSYKLTPTWCQTEEHWSSRFALSFWTSCPCCLFYRGFAVGFLPGLLMSIVLLLILMART